MKSLERIKINIDDCELCKTETIEYEKEINYDDFFQYRKRIAHWLWHEKGCYLLLPFEHIKRDPVNHKSIELSKYRGYLGVQEHLKISLIWEHDCQWTMNCYVDEQIVENKTVTIPEDIIETMDVNVFMNDCLLWVLKYRRAYIWTQNL